MQKISDSDFQDLPELAIRLITKQVLQAPRYVHSWNMQGLSMQALSYGYDTKTFYSDSKHYIIAIRQFSRPQVKSVPSIPSIRQEAEKYELQRQQMGYVTELELKLAKECLKTMTLEVDNTKEEATLKALRQLYGLLWLGYDTADPICLRLPKSSELTASISNQHRLQRLKEIRFIVNEKEQLFRLRNNVERNQSETARYVKDYLRAEAAKKKLGKNNSSLFGKLFSYFKPSEYTRVDEEDKQNKIGKEDQCEERLFQRKAHRTLKQKNKNM